MSSRSEQDEEPASENVSEGSDQEPLSDEVGDGSDDNYDNIEESEEEESVESNDEDESAEEEVDCEAEDDESEAESEEEHVAEEMDETGVNAEEEEFEENSPPVTSVPDNAPDDLIDENATASGSIVESLPNEDRSISNDQEHHFDEAAVSEEQENQEETRDTEKIPSEVESRRRDSFRSTGTDVHQQLQMMQDQHQQKEQNWTKQLQQLQNKVQMQQRELNAQTKLLSRYRRNRQELTVTKAELERARWKVKTLHLKFAAMQRSNALKDIEDEKQKKLEHRQSKIIAELKRKLDTQQERLLLWKQAANENADLLKGAEIQVLKEQNISSRRKQRLKSMKQALDESSRIMHVRQDKINELARRESFKGIEDDKQKLKSMLKAHHHKAGHI